MFSLLAAIVQAVGEVDAWWVVKCLMAPKGIEHESLGALIWLHMPWP